MIQQITPIYVRKRPRVAPPEYDSVKQKAYCAYGAARTLWSCRDEEILMDGPAGTGKTRAILEKINFCCMKYSRLRVLGVRKTRESMTESALWTYEDKVIPEGSPMLRGPQRNLRQTYRYPNGSEFVIGGMDKASKIMSTEYDIIAGFEATELTEEDHESLTTRLRNGRMPYQQIILDCNPGSPNHWLNARANTDKMTRLLSRHEDNPVLFNRDGTMTPNGSAYMRRLERLSGARYLRLRKGIWAASEGMVYESWDPFVHMVPRPRIESNWRRIRVIDFGYKNPFVCQWWAISPDDVMFLYRQIYFTKRLVADHAQTIRRYSEGENYEATISDHDAEDRATLHEQGIFTIPAHKAITPGIEAVNLRLRHEQHVRPTLFICRDSLVEEDTALKAVGLPDRTEDEFDGYVYPKDKDGKPVKEEPVKKDDHGMDTMRYGVCYVDNIAGMTLVTTSAMAVAVYRSN
jgi:phage terminase large subunit